MSLQVPLAAVPSQTTTVVLADQNCQLTLRLLGDLLYFSLSVDSAPLLINHVARNRTRMLLAQRYEGFRGDFVFVDTQGDTEPQFAGLNTRYILLYLTEAEIDAR